MSSRRRSVFLVLSAILISVVSYILMPSGAPELARRCVGLFVFAAFLWASEAIPLYATSLSLVALEILFLAQRGGLAGQGGLKSQAFLRPFSSGVIILFMGGFLLAKAMAKHGLDKMLAGMLLKPFASSPALLVFGVLAVTAAFSMWMSNTATTAMMLAVAAPVYASLPDNDRLGRAVALAVPFGANIGGLGTPIGTPPNAICLASLRSAGVHMGFVQWMLLSAPLVGALLLVSGGLLCLGMPKASHNWRPPSFPSCHIGPRGVAVLAILSAAVLLWLTSALHGIKESVVALLAAALLTACGILGKEDVDSIDWNILLLMWGGLSLSNAMSLTGLANWISGLPISLHSGLLLPALFALFAIGISTVISNTAAANLVIPLAMVSASPNPMRLAMVSAFACSLAMTLPVSTPPNAMAFATGRINARRMLAIGGMVGLAGFAMLLVLYQAVLPR